MSLSFSLFFDAALTLPVAAGTPIPAVQMADNSLAPVDVQLWLGSNAAGMQLQTSSNPGVDEITVSPADSSSGSGEPTTAIKLATSQAGLTAATAGASLPLATTVLSGVANAITFWARIDDATGVAGVYTDLSLLTNAVIES